MMWVTQIGAREFACVGCRGRMLNPDLGWHGVEPLLSCFGSRPPALFVCGGSYCFAWLYRLWAALEAPPPIIVSLFRSV